MSVELFSVFKMMIHYPVEERIKSSSGRQQYCADRGLRAINALFIGSGKVSVLKTIHYYSVEERTKEQ